MTPHVLDVRARYAAFEGGHTAVSGRSRQDARARRRRGRPREARPDEGVRAVENPLAAPEHELADVLWSLLVIAKRCDVELETAFARTMDELEAELGSSGDADS